MSLFFMYNVFPFIVYLNGRYIEIETLKIHETFSHLIRRSSRLDVATLQLLNSSDNECALSAMVSAVSKSSMRKTSIVIVENKGINIFK